MVATFVPGLPNTLLVQAFRNDLLPPSLYVVYREADMTFDAIVSFEPADPRARLDEVLRAFVAGDLFYPLVVRLMKADINRHFRRPIAH